MASPEKDAQKDDYLKSLPEGTDYHSRVVREGLWRQQGCEGQGRIIDAQLQDERDEGLDKVTKRWQEVKDANESIVTELSSRMGLQTLPPVDDPAGMLMKYAPRSDPKAEKEAERQIVKNQQLEHDIDMHEGRTMRQHEFFADAAIEPGREISARNVEGLELLERHRADYGTAAPQVTRDVLYELANLQLSWEQIQNLHVRLSDQPGTDYYYMKLVQKLCAGTEEGGKVVEGLKKCTEETSRVAHYASAAVDFFATSGKEFTDVPQLLKMLRKSDPLLDKLRGEVDRKYADRTKFLHEREDFAQAEKVHNEIDDLLGELFDVHSERLGILEGAGQDDTFIDDIKALGDKLKEIVMLENEEARKTNALGVVCDADIKRLENLVEGVQDRRKDEERRFALHRAEMVRRLNENADLQAAKFESITGLHQEILELAEDRKRLVDEMVKQRQQSEARRVARDNVPDLAAIHIKILQDLKSILPRLEPVLYETPRFVDVTVASISSQVERARADTAHFLLAEQRAFYKVFHEFYMCCGELVYVRERRLEEVESQIDDLRWRIEICPKVQDPNVKEYRNRVHRLEEERVELSSQIADLKKRMEDAAAEAAPVEEALSELGDEIVSPAILLQERNVRMQQEILQARRAAIERRGDRVDNQEEEMARVEQKANVAKKSGALTQHMLPQSAVESPRSPENKRALSEKRKKRYVERLRLEVDGSGKKG
eukprot:Hpha_TRINITY_DN13820_c0_g2::TRINITY_DN13820_c0_g2_i1::g.70091::m.70091